MNVQDMTTTIRGILDGVLNSGESGIIGRAREMTAFTQYLTKAGDLFAGNALVQQLLPNLLRGDFLQSPAPFNNPNDLFEAMGNLGQALPMDEAGNQVRQFIYGLAEAVAGASGSGLFGMGKKIDDHESYFLDFLKEKLGL